MVDPRTSDLTQNQTSRAVYEVEVAKTDRLAKLLRDATLTEGPFGWDAAMYSAVRFADEGVLLVGDAGSFIDPLSSAGVKKALASGWLAAVATHTALTRPAMRRTALEFFSAREQEIYAAFRALTERFLADAATNYDHPFWSDRTDPAMASDDDALRAAFDWLRSADSIHLCAAPDVAIEQKPAVSGNEIVLEPRLVTGTGGDGVRYAFDVDLVALIDLAPRFAQVPDLFDAYNQRLAPVALPQFLSALAMAIAKGWLVDSRGASL
jgi:Tryptophan halogenase